MKEDENLLSIIKYFKDNQLNVQPNNFSRYKRLSKILEDTEEQYIESYEPIQFEKTSTDVYHLVTLADVNRLDLVAFQYYRNPSLWWVIAEASELTDPFDIPLGTILRVPQITRVYHKMNIISY